MRVIDSDNTRQVLDASALLALLNREFGYQIVQRAIQIGTHMSVVNWAEALSRIAEKSQDVYGLANRFRRDGMFDTSLVIEPLTSDDCIEIALLRPMTKSCGLGLGDRSCLALAKRLNLPVLTADKIWSSLDLGITINLLR